MEDLPILLFPCSNFFLLQRWYGLSDPGLEEALNDRISFIRFSGFLCISSLTGLLHHLQIQKRLLELGLYEKLFEEIVKQLEGKGLLVQEGAIVDATIIESSRRPRKVMEIMPEDRKEEKTETPPVVTYSDDTDATWIKKGKRPYYGYKAHISVDTKDGYVLGGHVTPANVADTTELEKLIDESRPSRRLICSCR